MRIKEWDAPLLAAFARSGNYGCMRRTAVINGPSREARQGLYQGTTSVVAFATLEEQRL